MFANEADIDWMAQQPHACPNVRKGVAVLQALKDAVNAQSDGWAYWQAPSTACEKLLLVLATAGNLQYGTRGKISAADLKKALVPIRAMVTRQKRIQKKYGNTFEFDVDAALRAASERT